MKSFINLLILVFLFSVISTLTAQYTSKDLKNGSQKLGKYTLDEWRTVIDTTWGEGLPTDDKLEIFDLFWNTIDEDFGGFHNLDVNWDSLRNIFRPEIEAGVSRGRFSGIMSHLYLALNETHTNVLDLDVYHEELRPGIPLLVCQSGYNYTDNGHFGAGLTPLPDSSLLVYKVIEDHPLGLALGDIVLGYEGIPWKNLYRQLLEAQLPVTSHTEPFWSFDLYVFGGSSDKSTEHIWLTSAGLNWHLFDTIDIVKYGSTDTLHLPTSDLIGLDAQLFCTEQMPIPGVPMPDHSKIDVSWITWGVIEGTQIGYIYVSSWVWQDGDDIAFTHAVNSLIDLQTTGLIIDSRINAGGQTQTANGGFRRLFNFDLDVLKFAERSNPNDHYAMKTVTSGGCSSQYWRLSADQFLYDRPIAVLSGPASWSAGDDNVLLLKFHPMARIFGKPTNTGFTCFKAFGNLNIPFQGWFGQYAPMNSFLADDPDNYLMHVGFDIDEEVWLTQEDVAKGEDTVVKAAMAWINSMIHAYNVKSHSSFITPLIDTLTITSNVANPNNHNINIASIINTLDNILVDSIPMFDDGNHGDSLAGDGLYGSYLNPLSSENVFTISASVTDLDSNYYHLLPNATRFTTIGPVLVEDFYFYGSDTIPNHGDPLLMKIILKNEGTVTTASNISATLTAIDTNAFVTRIINPNYGNIAAGATATTGGFYQIRFNDVEPDSIFAYFKLEIGSEDYVFWTNTISIFMFKDPTGILSREESIPKQFSLNQNYPNPFNPSTTIEFTLPKSEYVKLKVYNILGKEVTTLASNKLNPGNHIYTFDGKNLASGIYYYQLVAGDYREVKKMILLR